MAALELLPTSSHRAIRDALREHEPGLWQWYASDEFGAEYADRVRLELLKDTYRLEPDAHDELYAVAAGVAHKLGVTVPITFYQARSLGAEAMNAGLCFVPDAAHVVLTGPVLARLEPDELRALLGHELAHHRLWNEEHGSYRVADAVLEAVACHPSAAASWIQLALRQRRCTELYADRGALVANDGDLHAALRCLLKISAGIAAPDAVAYLRQVDEVMAKSTDASAGETHPELFLRAWAMQRWLAGSGDADAAVMQRLKGARTLEALDLLDQLELSACTQQLIAAFLHTPWLRSESILVQARQYLPDLQLEPEAPNGPVPVPALSFGQGVSDSIADYFGYVLLDLVTADADLLDEALAAALAFADSHGFGASFDKLARKELRSTVAKLAELRQRWPRIQEQFAAAARRGEA